MSRVITTGYTWVSGATVTADRLNQMVNSATLDAEPQVLTVENTTYTAISALTPNDNTIPDIGEGTEILSLAITPASTASRIRAQFSGSMGSSANAYVGVFALYRGTTCISAKAIYGALAAPHDVTFDVVDSPASASAQTYSVRLGLATASQTVYINGVGSRLLGGAQKQVLTLTEIKG